MTRGDTLEVQLAQPLARGEEAVVAIEYSSVEADQGAIWLVPTNDNPDRPYELWTQGQEFDSKAWFPTYDYPNDFRTSQTRITAHQKFTAIANGDLVEVTNNADDTKTWHYKMDVPPHLLPSDSRGGRVGKGD